MPSFRLPLRSAFDRAFLLVAVLTALLLLEGCISGEPGGEQEVALDPNLGVSWQRQKDSTFKDDYWDITWTGKLFVAVGEHSVIRTSPDGSMWTNHNPEGSIRFRKVVWSGKQLLAFADDVYFSSKDGLKWDTAWSYGPFGLKPTFFDAVWAQNQWVALVSSGVMTSPDGRQWTNHNISGDQGSALVWTGKQYVSVGGLGQIYTSVNGLDWTLQNSGSDHLLNDVVWTGTQLVAVGASVALTSPDGVAWQAHPVSRNLNSVVWTGNRLIAVGLNGALLTSEDGINWTSRDGISGSNYISVAASRTLAVAVGWDGLVRTSPGNDTLFLPSP